MRACEAKVRVIVWPKEVSTVEPPIMDIPKEDKPLYVQRTSRHQILHMNSLSTELIYTI